LELFDLVLETDFVAQKRIHRGDSLRKILSKTKVLADGQRIGGIVVLQRVDTRLEGGELLLCRAEVCCFGCLKTTREHELSQLRWPSFITHNGVGRHRSERDGCDRGKHDHATQAPTSWNGSESW